MFVSAWVTHIGTRSITYVNASAKMPPNIKHAQFIEIGVGFGAAGKKMNIKANTR